MRFLGCGKTTSYIKLKDKIDILDSDSSTFDKKDFPNNYIKHIKENIGKVDVIFVSSHQIVRNAMKENSIIYSMYYPAKRRKKEMLELYKMRGNNEDFIWFLENNFEFFIDNIEKENIEGAKIRLENEGDFILNDQLFDNLIKQIIKNNEENNK
nr:hypothetical protein [Clostridia bacterium]